MSIRNRIFGVSSVTVSDLIRYDSLLQNATAILLQNATEVYYKMRQVFYYKMRQLLQTATILLQTATVITKCDVYYKLRQYMFLKLLKKHSIQYFMYNYELRIKVRAICKCRF